MMGESDSEDKPPTTAPVPSRFEYTRRHLRREEIPQRYNRIIEEMTESGWELASIKPTYGYVRTFWEQQGRGPFQGCYLIFRRKV
jgi:hypothetical protein